MKTEKIVLNFDGQKLQAIKIFSPKDGLSIEEQLIDHLEKLYQKIVPQPTRLYIEEMQKSASANTKKQI